MITTKWKTKLALALCFAVPDLGVAQNPLPRDLTQVNLEDLMNVQVTSVSKKEQRLWRAGAAIFVISQEDIRRSGATNIPDLLRMVPGVDIAQITANTYAISIRGFSDRFANKVLVLIDGRSVYSPLNSGVQWDQQHVPLEDIDRIEVIRGPGGSIWGANAVNGVISIITKSAKATKGGLVRAGVGSQDSMGGVAQYGGSIGQSGAYRIFGDYSAVGNLPSPNGENVTNSGHRTQQGFRSDWDYSSSDAMTVQGDLLQVHEAQTMHVPLKNNLPSYPTFDDRISVTAGNVLGRWDHVAANGSDTTLQVYDDAYSRRGDGFDEVRNTVDIDFQHHLTAGPRHDIVWGFGYRFSHVEVSEGQYHVSFLPAHRVDNLVNVFLQDEIKLSSSVWLTLGSKFEHNSYTGFEYEPSAKLVWTPTDHQAIWASAARAIRQPAQVDFGLNVDLTVIPTGPTSFSVLQVLGNPNLKAEKLYDLEIGYRAQIAKQFSLDVVGFSSIYHDLRTYERQTPFFTTAAGPPHVVIPMLFGNLGHAHNYGVEASTNWNVTNRWRLSPGYTYLQMDVNGDPGTKDTAPGKIENESPKHQVQVRSFLNLTRHLDWDTTISKVGHLNDGGQGSTPGYLRLDTRLGWRVGENTEFSVVGQNLLSPAHAEYHDAYGIEHSLVPRSVFAKVTWRF
jgi:iron complex outermembrane receptor protein